MQSGKLMNMIIQPAHSVWRDMWANRRWIFVSVAPIVVWTVLSAFFFYGLENDQKIDLLSSFYFTIVNITTVGFGDIHPVTVLGKLLAIVNSFVGVLAFGIVISIISAAFQSSQSTARRSIGYSDGPNDALSDTNPSSQSDSAVEPIAHPLFSFLNSLRPFIGGEDISSLTTHHIRIRTTADSSSDNHGDDILIVIDISVHRNS